MPTIFNEKGFRFFFYSNEHLPKHIHVTGKGGEVKIELDSLTLVYNFGVKKNDLKAIMEIAEKNRFFFIKSGTSFTNYEFNGSAY
ncbi:protein of unknown function [Salegentibacter holothuriorum]|uniref:DUF4160 domain-containing protein n=1 Tax=Salegentibacter holothuriorum TaxID=241145 RepID=A0A1T5BGA8_9FLAO|nr:protein of unknown function [Salegentibacter holothuriorum]